MAISIETELGEVKITRQVIAGIISDIMSEPGMSDRIWPATEHGHAIGKRSMIAEIVDIRDTDFASNIEVTTADSGEVTIEFSVIVRFGVSIKTLNRTLSDRIVNDMHYLLGVSPSVIIINIAGVKSRQIARRNTRTIYRYND
ncbi:MAG: Asp23/Gls24 family envelope stress response protein [Eubacterium sp.]|nr:Asp23/Gls24 family envelope stress response protein [Eubacterium sp.]